MTLGAGGQRTLAPLLASPRFLCRDPRPPNMALSRREFEEPALLHFPWGSFLFFNDYFEKIQVNTTP